MGMWVEGIEGIDWDKGMWRQGEGLMRLRGLKILRGLKGFR